MGIFGKSNSTPDQKTGVTVVAEGTHIKGGIDTKGSIHIDGRFEGVLFASSMITIGKSGEVFGDIKCNTLTINGFIDGVVDCENVHILSDGKILGKMVYKNLVIEENGVFEGEGKVKNSTLTSRYKGYKEGDSYFTDDSLEEVIEEPVQIKS